MAEISVPAWPIPTHHTKLMIAQPHPTGLFSPQIPVPSQMRYPMDASNNPSRALAGNINKYHALGVGRRLTSVTRWVILAKSWSPFTRAGSGTYWYLLINAVMGTERDTGHSFSFSEPPLAWCCPPVLDLDWLVWQCRKYVDERLVPLT